MAWYKVASPLQNDESFIKKVKAGSQTVCLINNEGALHAVSAKCPHAGADLSAGWCEQGKLVCPYHRYSYDLLTGRGSPGQNDYVSVYPVDSRDDGIYVEINSLWEKIKRIFH
ncbi:Rieske (2Fe-2S) protein [Mucilaginibacter sp. Bleaf8]|uniref:Rieske (2Fe-2S) protein n=1 Tax=Mucilaginibacter sp. Bleaf8 TaxID=2834430 RepID=UPI001BCAFC67|nr:Rieske (2Fe-2S) protein [Mucilaginibacter sp. Bleaf8]MBS7563343.1 Rieske (2Fe-2S) protein [Mucilaginibacter sp. Bleaf8]